MTHQRLYHGLARLVALAWLVVAVTARHGGYGGGEGGGYRGGWYDGDDADDGADADSAFGRGGTGTGTGSDSDAGFGRDGSGAPFDITQAMNYGRIHGILAALAFVVLFPVGSILMRVVPGRFAVWVHAGAQVLGFGTYVAAAGLGIYLVTMIRTPVGGLLEMESTRYHPIIGLIILALLLVQPVLGLLHHRVYKKVQKRQMWSYLHLTIGRVGITLGIINGGLGLHIARASDYHKRTYAIVAAIIWTLWMTVGVWSEIRRAKRNRQAMHAAVAKAHVGHERTSQE